MTSLLGFGLFVITISVSGVMSPGPLFAANITYGIRGGWKSGLRMACGHTIIELPLVVLLGIGIISLSSLPQFQVTASILGATSLFAFAGLQIRSVLLKKESTYIPRHSPVVVGILLTGLNPFFVAWWFTLGLKMIADAIVLYSTIGIAIMFAFHIWMDYAWMGTVGFLSNKGRNILSDKYYKIFILAISLVLIYFGINFLVQAKL